MKKLLLSAVFCIFALCGLARADYPAQTKIYFNINLAYAVKAGEVIIPSGQYAIRTLGLSNSSVLALSERGKSQPLVIMHTVRIDRRLQDYTDQPHVVFDTEGGIPVMKKILIPSEDGYEILSAIADKDLYKNRRVIHVNQTTTVETAKPEPVPEPAPEPQPEAQPEPAPAPQVEQPAPQVEEPAPAPAPIKERKRVRKD